MENLFFNSISAVLFKHTCRHISINTVTVTEKLWDHLQKYQASVRHTFNSHEPNGLPACLKNRNFAYDL